MADKVVVKAEKREGRGKNDTRRLRNEGKIPLSVYGGGGESLALVAELGDLAAILRSETGPNTVFSLDVDGVGASDVIFQDRQIDPIKGRLIHADLRRLTKGEKIEMTVPIQLVGVPSELEEGAMLSQTLREIKVKVEPANVPDFFEADVSGLNVGESIHISDLKIGQGIEVLDDPGTTVASIVIVKEPELEPTPEEELTEPELVGEEGEETEGAEGTEGEPETEEQ